MKKAFFAALVLAAVSVLYSCGIIIIGGGDGDIVTAPPETTVSKVEIITPDEGTRIEAVRASGKEDAKKALEALRAEDLEDIGVIIAAVDSTCVVPGEEESFFSDAVSERNAAVEKKYNTTVMSVEGSSDAVLKDAVEAYNSGLYFADILSIPLSKLGAFQASGILMNLNTLPFTDFSAPYFNKGLIDQASAGHYIYAVSGDANENPGALYTVFFNTDMIKELSLESPYDMVRSGSWTIDKYTELSKAASASGYYGHCAAEGVDRYIDIMYAASGEKYISAESGRLPKLEPYTSRVNNIILKIGNLIFRSDALLDPASDAELPMAANAFYDGKLMFYIGTLSDAAMFRDMEDGWGILPLPKFDEAQEEYYSFASKEMSVWAATADNADVEKTGIVIQALNAASYNYLGDAYAADLMYNILRDNDSLFMLDYIRKNVVSGFSFMFGEKYSEAADNTHVAIRDAVRGTTDTTEKHYENRSAKLDKFAEKYFPMLGN